MSKLRASENKSKFNSRSTITSCLVIFSTMLVWIYIDFLSRFYYLGFTYSETFIPFVFLSFGMLLLSSFALPLEIKNLSDSMLWVMFWLLYSPIVLLVPLQVLEINAKVLFLISIAVSFHLMILASNIKIKLPFRISSSKLDFYVPFFSVYGLLIIYILIVFGGHMQLVSFDDVYDLRHQNDSLQNGTLVGYASGMLAWAFNPFLISIGLVEKKRLFVIIGAIGQLFLYSTLGHKGVFLSTGIIFLFYYLYINFEVIESYRLARLVVIICLIPMVPYLFYGVPDEIASSDNNIVTQLISVVYMRSFGMVAAMMGVYVDFFQTHPYTFYSHINIVSLFIDYPYNSSIGEIVGYNLTQSALNANASFFATDGYAALGNTGVVIIGPIVGLFFSLANAMTVNSLKIACASFVPFIMILCNSSFFTSLLTGGGLILVLFIYLSQQSKLHILR